MASPNPAPAVNNAQQSFGNTTAGVQTCALAAKTSVRKAVSAWLSFHPYQFAPHENPASPAGFTLQMKSPYGTEHLLGDGRSKAVIRLTLVKIPPGTVVTDGTQLTAADSGWCGGEGTVVISLSNPDAGTLTWQGQKGAVLRIPTGSMTTGVTDMQLSSINAIVFTAGSKLADATLSVTIEGCSSYDYLPSILIPKKSRDQGYKYSLTVGVREVGVGAEGYDVLKAQWYLGRFKFMAHEVKRVDAKGVDNAWTGLKDMETSGKLAKGDAVALKDFQFVALSGYRNRGQKTEAVVFTGTPRETARPDAALEMARWDDLHYTVECYHGDTDLKFGTAAGPQTAAGKITYGVVHDESKPLGYVDIQSPIGNSTVALASPAANVDVARNIRCAVRMFLKDTLIWRLHDADEHDKLASELVHQPTANRFRQTLGDLRRRQTSTYGDADSFDPALGRAYESYEGQDAIYAKGRTANSDMVKGHRRCGCKYPSHPSLPCLIHGATPCQCPIEAPSCQKVEGDWRHEFGRKPVTNGPGGHSWHNFGMAIDVNYYFMANGHLEEDKQGRQDVMGQIGKGYGLTWGGDWTSPYDPGHLQTGAPVGKAVPNSVRHVYNGPGLSTPKARLEAVWRSLNI